MTHGSKVTAVLGSIAAFVVALAGVDALVVPTVHSTTGSATTHAAVADDDNLENVVPTLQEVVVVGGEEKSKPKAVKRRARKAGAAQVRPAPKTDETGPFKWASAAALNRRSLGGHNVRSVKIRRNPDTVGNSLTVGRSLRGSGKNTETFVFEE